MIIQGFAILTETRDSYAQSRFAADLPLSKKGRNTGHIMKDSRRRALRDSGPVAHSKAHAPTILMNETAGGRRYRDRIVAARLRDDVNCA
jgi:hypothetical protein